MLSKIAIVEFLKRCVEYADDSIQRKKDRGDSETVISEWQTYRDYTKYALGEIERGELNHWFERKVLKAENEIILDQLDHLERAKWLFASVSPRPLALVSTRDSDGKENLAPMSSLSVVSNTPPLVVMSLSQTREGVPRDTYSNLIATKKCELQFVAPNLQAAKDVDLASSFSQDSEWDLLDLEGPIHPLAVVVLHCTLLEDRALPDGAVARLVTLRVEKAIVPSDVSPEEGFSILCQHGLDRLTPSPHDWGFEATKHHR